MSSASKNSASALNNGVWQNINANQSFSWIGTSAFSGKAGQLHMIDQGSQVLVQGDVDGDRKADFDILVKVATLSAGDFIV